MVSELTQFLGYVMVFFAIAFFELGVLIFLIYILGKYPALKYGRRPHPECDKWFSELEQRELYRDFRNQ